MIRFSAALVVAAIGVLIGGVATSSLLLVYVAIGISALALVVLAVGVALKRDELFGDEARSATSGTPERAGQPAGQQEQPASSAVPLASGASSYGSAFSRDHVSAPQSHGTDRPADASRFPGQPGAWPPAESGFPPAPVSSDQPSGTPQRSRRPAAPPTRADPVLPWADALPTRVDLTKGVASSEPVPSWLEGTDDQPADLPLGTLSRRPADSGEVAGQDAPVPATAPGDGAEAGSPSGTATADTVTRDADDASVGDVGAGAGEAPGADAPEAGEPDAHAGGTDAAALGAASTGGGVPDPADLTDEAIALPDPEPDALSPVDPEPGAPEAPGAEPAGADEPAGGDESGQGKRLSGTEQVTVVPGVPRYHVSDCILIRFMDDEDVQRMTAAEAEQAGCTPCSACQPED